MTNEILRIARRIQALSQAGLEFTTDNFDRQRYSELRELSVQLASQVSDAEPGKIRDLFTYETGFQTPKVDIRAVVLEGEKILLTRERSDDKWSMPGGYADINLSPTENAEKEVLEETGLKVRVNRILAVIDASKHGFPPLEFHYYKIVILCDRLGGELRGSDETHESRFFGFDELPELSTRRNTSQLFELIRQQIKQNGTYLD